MKNTILTFGKKKISKEKTEIGPQTREVKTIYFPK
jgi:hypothetical protein